MDYFSSNPILTVNIKGGIGNQLFQIAAAYGLSKDLNMKMAIFKNQFEGCGQGSHPSKYYDTFYKNLPMIDPIPINHKIQERSWTVYNISEDILQVAEQNSCIQIDGYFQSEEYFKKYRNELRKLFIPENGVINYLEKNTKIFDQFPELKDSEYMSKCAVIGVRRGDYVERASFHNPCNMIYYNKAMEKMGCEKYYIMSDDMNWVKANFVGDQYRYIDMEDDLNAIFIFALFKNYIISNSSFYWWGSYLSVAADSGTRIIAPDKWLFGPHAPFEAYWSIYRDCMEIIERPV